MVSLQLERQTLRDWLPNISSGAWSAGRKCSFSSEEHSLEDYRMELHSGPLPPLHHPILQSSGQLAPICGTLTRQHLPPGLQSAVKQLFGERSSPVIKLVTRKTEGSQLANCVKEWLMTIFELFSCKWGYWEGHIEINFLHLLTPSLGINYSSRKQGDKSLWKLQKIWAEWPQAQATYYDGSSQIAWWGKKPRRRVAIQTAKLERLLDHCSWGNILGDMLKSRFLWANREIWEPSLAAGA